MYIYKRQIHVRVYCVLSGEYCLAESISVVCSYLWARVCGSWCRTRVCLWVVVRVTDSAGRLCYAVWCVLMPKGPPAGIALHGVEVADKATF